MEMCMLDTNNKEDHQVRPINLIELSSAFLVLGVGLSLSALAFIVERLSAPHVF